MHGQQNVKIYGPVFASLNTNVLSTSLHKRLDDTDQTQLKG